MTKGNVLAYAVKSLKLSLDSSRENKILTAVEVNFYGKSGAENVEKTCLSLILNTYIIYCILMVWNDIIDVPYFLTCKPIFTARLLQSKRHCAIVNASKRLDTIVIITLTIFKFT